MKESNPRLRLEMLKINLFNCCTFSFVWKQVNLFNVVLTTRRTPRLRCWGDSNPRISAVTGRHPNQLNDSTVYRETKTKCVTITPYIGTYKPMQQDSNPHLSFYLKKYCRKIAVSFPIFRTFLMICHHPKSRTWKLAIYLRWGLPQVYTPLVMNWAARSVSMTSQSFFAASNIFSCFTPFIPSLILSQVY